MLFRGFLRIVIASTKHRPVKLKNTQPICILMCILAIPAIAHAADFGEYKAVFSTPCADIMTLNTPVPDLTQFTVCTYMKLASSDPWTAFTYKLPSSSDNVYEIGVLGDSSSMKIWMFGTQINVLERLNLHTWYEICIKWEGKTGSMEFYLDGTLKIQRTLENINQLDGGGSVALGCSYFKETSATVSMGLVGELYMFRMWDTVEGAMLQTCIDGSVIRWKKDDWIFSTTVVQKDSSLHCAKKQSEIPSSGQNNNNIHMIHKRAVDAPGNTSGIGLGVMINISSIPSPTSATTVTNEGSILPNTAPLKNGTVTNTLTSASSAFSAPSTNTNITNVTTEFTIATSISNMLWTSSVTTNDNSGNNNYSTSNTSVTTSISETTNNVSNVWNSSESTYLKFGSRNAPSGSMNCTLNGSSVSMSRLMDICNASCNGSGLSHSCNSSCNGSAYEITFFTDNCMNAEDLLIRHLSPANIIHITNCTNLVLGVNYTTTDICNVLNSGFLNMKNSIQDLNKIDYCCCSEECPMHSCSSITSLCGIKGGGSTTTTGNSNSDLTDGANTNDGYGRTATNVSNTTVKSGPTSVFTSESSVIINRETATTINIISDKTVITGPTSTTNSDSNTTLTSGPAITIPSNKTVATGVKPNTNSGSNATLTSGPATSIVTSNKTVITGPTSTTNSGSNVTDNSGPTTTNSESKTTVHSGTTRTNSESSSSANTITQPAATEVLEKLKDLLGSGNLNSSIVDSIVTDLENMLAGEVSPDTATKLVGILNYFFNVSQNLLTRVSKRLIKVVDQIGLKLTFPGQSINITSPSLALAVDKVNVISFAGTSFGVESSSDLQVSLGSQAPLNSDGSILLPASLLNDLLPAEKNIASRLQFNYFAKTAFFTDSSLTSNQSLVSKVISSSVANLTVTKLKENITVTLKTSPINDSSVRKCVFWDFNRNNGSGGWASDGCTVVWTQNQNETVCKCNHLTSFAILMDVTPNTQINPEDTLILTFITYIGCGLSSIFLSVTLVTYIAFEKIRRDYPSKILIQLCAALVCLNLTFLLNPWIALYNDIPGLCISVAAFLHYFVLVSITWMGLEAFHMYLSLVKVFNTYVRKYILKFCIIGWGAPAVVIAIILAVNRDLYNLKISGTYPNGAANYFCWMDDIIYFITVVGYFGIIFLLNVSMFVVVLIQLCRIKKQKQLGYQRKTTLQDMRSVAGITFLLGITWGLGFFSFGPGKVVIVYLFTICNTLQGFFIFYFYCVAKENVRKQWRRYLCCGKFRLAENSDWSKTATNKLNKQTSKQGVSSSSSNSIQSTSNSNSTTLLVSNEYSLHPNGNGNVFKERNGVSFIVQNGDMPLEEFRGRPSTRNGDAQRTSLRRTSNRGSVHFVDQI